MQDVSSSLLSNLHINTGQESREQYKTKYSFEIHRLAAAALSPDRLSLLSSSTGKFCSPHQSKNLLILKPAKKTVIIHEQEISRHEHCSLNNN